MSDKVICERGEIWYRDMGKDYRSIGLTPDFLRMVQDECWNIIPNQGTIKKGQPLFSVETNDSLLSVISPFNGVVKKIDFNAQNSPEKLTEDTEVLAMYVGTPEVKKKPAPRASQLFDASRAFQTFNTDNFVVMDEVASTPIWPPRTAASMASFQERERALAAQQMWANSLRTTGRG